MKKDARIRARGAEAAKLAANSDSRFEPLADSMRALAEQSAIDADNWASGATDDFAHDIIGDYSGDGTSFGPSLTILTDARAECERLGTPTR